MESNGVFTREHILTFALAVVTSISLYLCFLLVAPFITSLAFALALRVATRRPFGWIRHKVGNITAASAIAVVCVALLIIGPLSGILTYLVQTAIQNVQSMQSETAMQDLRARIESTPYVGPVVQLAEERLQLGEQLSSLGKTLAGKAGQVLSGSLGVLTQLVITLFVLFFLYRDGDSAVRATRRLLPLGREEADRMFTRVSETIEATVNGTITVSTIQALLAGTMYAILGVPLAVIWGAATFFAAFVPVFGTALVWVPVTLYLLIAVSWVKALILLAFASLAVGSIDNVLYPFLVGGKLRMHTVPTFFAVLGGVTVFGVAGIILGPLVMAITIGLLDVWWRRTQQGQPAEESIAAKPPEVPPSAVLQERGKRGDD